MSTDLYYFTGTGNSLAVARHLAEKTGAALRSIAAAMRQERITPGADALGLVFPVYHKGIPLILKRFVEKLENLSEKYVFAVGTYGDTPGMAVRHLAGLVAARGGRLAAGFGVHMPYNYITPPRSLRDFYGSFTLREIPVETRQALLAGVPARVERIDEYVSARKPGAFEVTTDVLTRLADALGLSESLGKSSWLKIAGVREPTDLPFIESRQLMDRAFWADGRCVGCGTCSRVCPVGNIQMIAGANGQPPRPRWQHRCEQCMACLHWCPQEAIQFRRGTAGRQRYHHPGVTLADMLRQASGE